MPESASTASASPASGSAEFTGERVIPGQVDVNLWNEHMARYAFASRLSRSRRVLDLGCGSGYGSFELARHAIRVTGVDPAGDALGYASTHYTAQNLRWAHASATTLPFKDESFDLVVAFEVIEHLGDWREMLNEARRVLGPGGQFIVSTPNKIYYAASRRLTGPNPFHEHEFEFAEFEEALRGVFPHVSLFLEDHTEGILFQAITNPRGAEVRLDQEQHSPEAANFFIAVCAMTAQTGSPTFVYVPTTGNLLRERELHISRLEEELQTKNEWLNAARTEHAELVELFRKQTAELQDRTKWAQQLSAQLAAAGERIVQLQEEVASDQAAAAAVIAALEEENRQKTQWAQETDARLTAELAAKCEELAEAVRLLERAEATVEERTKWALELDASRQELEARLAMVQASRWVRLGRAFGVGPQLKDR